MTTSRTEKQIDGRIEIALAADLYLEPELVRDDNGSPVFTIAVSRTRSSGTIEITRLRVELPRDTVTRILCEIRKLHEAERAQILEDVAAFGGRT